jgi:hypothetical protein
MAEPPTYPDAASAGPSLAELEALSTEELRHRAFELAERRHDFGFLWDVTRHLKPTADAATEDGSSGSIGEVVADLVGIVRGLAGKDGYGEGEPLLRAKFIDYLRGGG